MIKEVKEGKMTMFHQIKTVNKKTKITKKEPNGNCGVKKYMLNLISMRRLGGSVG